jgi:hypothetical protein
MPDGSYAGVSELPTFGVGLHYILFLSNNKWSYSPIWSRLAFRIEHLGGKDVALGPDGHTVLSFGVEGVHFGTKQLVQPAAGHTPNAATPLIAGALDSLADVQAALNKSDFIKNAVSAATAVSAPIGSPVPLAPAFDISWGTTPTAPPAQ